MVTGRASALFEEYTMNPTVCTHKNNPNFWIFGLFFFLYFFIMATCFPFLPIWLSDVIGLNKTETGLVFSSLSLFAICFQPILGVISDKLGLKKHLLWIISVLLFLFAPFFIYVFAPLLKLNIVLGAIRLVHDQVQEHRRFVFLVVHDLVRPAPIGSMLHSLGWQKL